MVEALDLNSIIGLRDRVLLFLLSVQAWRIGEVLGLRVEDLGEEGGHRVAVVRGKGGKNLRVTLAANVWLAIQDWLAEAGIEEGPVIVPVFKGGRVQPGKAMSPQAGWQRVRKLGRRAGMTRPVHPHLFRHTAATVLLDMWVPLRDVHDHLRHADPRTTRRYDSHRLRLNTPSPHTLSAAFSAEEPDG